MQITTVAAGYRAKRDASGNRQGRFVVENVCGAVRLIRRIAAPLLS
jgi:hypothetical protein